MPDVDEGRSPSVPEAEDGPGCCCCSCLRARERGTPRALPPPGPIGSAEAEFGPKASDEEPSALVANERTVSNVAVCNADVNATVSTSSASSRFPRREYADWICAQSNSIPIIATNTVHAQYITYFLHVLYSVQNIYVLYEKYSVSKTNAVPENR